MGVSTAYNSAARLQLQKDKIEAISSHVSASSFAPGLLSWTVLTSCVLLPYFHSAAQNPNPFPLLHSRRRVQDAVPVRPFTYNVALLGRLTLDRS